MKPTKRKFIPSFDSFFGDQKRYKGENAPEKVQTECSYPLGWASRAEIHEKASSFPAERDSLLNSMYFTNTLPSNTSQKAINPQPTQFSRPKYKAKIQNSSKSSTSLTSHSIHSSLLNPSSSQSFSRSFSVSEATFLNKSQRQLTVPKPFNLSMDVKSRHNCISQQNFEFTAREMPDFSVPFTLRPSERPTTKPSEVYLNTSDRAVRREIFNEQISKKERDAENMRQFEIEERERWDREQVKAIRKQMEFKAMPYTNNTVFMLKPSQIPPTVPRPPHLETEVRAYYRSL